MIIYVGGRIKISIDALSFFSVNSIRRLLLSAFYAILILIFLIYEKK